MVRNISRSTSSTVGGGIVVDNGDGTWTFTKPSGVNGSCRFPCNTEYNGTGEFNWAFGSVEVKYISGSGTLVVDVSDGSNKATIDVTTLTDWVKLAAHQQPLSSRPSPFLDVQGDTTDLSEEFTVLVRNAVIDIQPEEIVEKKATEFVPYGSAQFFPYENGNTVDENGVVTEAKGADIDGIAYLNEPSATNVCVQSEDLTDPSWSPLGVTVIRDGEVRGIPAFRITDQTTVWNRLTAPPSMVGLQTVVVSCYLAEQQNSEYFCVYFRDGGAGAQTELGYRFSDGTVTLLNGVNVGTLDNWWFKDGRLSMRFTWDTSELINCRVGFGTRSADPTDWVRFAAPQIEATPGPSSYIPTAGGPVTRGADYLKYIDVDINEDISFLVDQESLYESGDYAGSDIRLVNSPGGNPAIRTFGDSTWSFVASGACNIVPSEVSTQERTRTVLSRTATDALAALGGELKAKEGTVLDHPHSVSDTYEIGHWSQTGQVYAGLFHRVMLFDEALSEEEALDLSGNEYACPEDK
jgi:hypothetical protein